MTEICPAHRGAVAELLASAWLFKQGFEVFRNLSASGPGDLIAWNPKTNKHITIDVKSSKSVYQRANGISLPYLSQKIHPNVSYLYVIDDEVIGFVRKGSDAKLELYDPLN